MARDPKGRFVPASRLAAGTEVELADVPDIDRPDKLVSVVVARRIDPLLSFLNIRKRELDDAQYYLAAQQLRRDVAISEQYRGGQASLEGVTGGGGSDGIPMVIVNARTRVRGATEAMRGRDNSLDIVDVIRLVVVGWVPVSVLEKQRRYQSGDVRSLLSSGLKRLAAHYGLVDGGRVPSSRQK